MASTVRISSSVYSTYISTVDHLPCDVVRSLWLVQACNIAADTEKQKLHDFLKQYRYNTIQLQPNRQEITQVYEELRRRILRWESEALAELENLDIQLKTHRVMLLRGVDLLSRIAPPVPLLEQRTKCEMLKLQLDQHYRDNPLASQIEALQERVLKGLRNVIIKHVPGQASGVKIIFKFPKDKRKILKDTLPEIPPAVKRQRPTRHQSVPSAPGSPPLPETTPVLSEGETSNHSRKRGRPRKISVESLVEPPAVLDTVPEPVKKIPHVTKVSIALPRQEPEAPELYCFCHQPSFGDMIACDNEKCSNGEWFHYKCVGLLSRANAKKYQKQKWYCSVECKDIAEKAKPKKRRRRNRW